MSKQNTKLTFVKFAHSAKTVDAVAMTPEQDALFVMGEELGAMAAGDFYQFADALKACHSHSDRMCLRAGFVSTYATMRKVSEDSAIKKFNRLAAEHAPQTSRKHASNAKKSKGGRPEKTATGKVSKLSEKDVAARLVKALAYISKAQAKYEADSDTMDVLGEIAAILGGK